MRVEPTISNYYPPMQYNPTDLKKESKLALKWHGEDTLVRIEGEDEKRVVKTGDVISVSPEQAKKLLRYSSDWTLKGDKVVDHPFKNRSEFVERSTLKPQDTGVTHPLVGDPSKIKTRAKVIDALKQLNATFNDQASEAELRDLLNELVTESMKKPEETKDGESNEKGDLTAEEKKAKEEEDAKAEAAKAAAAKVK